MEPKYLPDPPAPQIARPTIRVSMVGAAPAMAQPTEKTTKLTPNVHFALYRAYKSPLDGCLWLVQPVPESYSGQILAKTWHLAEETRAPRGHHEGDTQPGKLVEGLKCLDHGRLNIRGNSVVSCKQEVGHEDACDDQSP